MKKFLLLLYSCLIACISIAASATPISSYPGKLPMAAVHTGNASPAPHLRVQLYKDSINTDDTYIEFDSTASINYVFNEDAKYLQGYGEVSMASISGDNINLAINRLPFPQQSENIRLYVGAQASGAYKLNITEDVNIPSVFNVWLMDNYTKDSLQVRQGSTYAFNILKSDTSSFGSNRFSLVIRQNVAAAVHLLSFTATKGTDGADLAWKTENELGNTNFTVERSLDSGATFAALSNFMSDSAGSYSYVDNTPATGTDFYRLKITDFTGNSSYSGVVSLDYESQPLVAVSSNISVYPNPAVNVLNLSMAALISNNSDGKTLSSLSPPPSNTVATASYGIKIISLTGAIVRTGTTTSQTWQTDVSGLMPGTYIIQMVKNGDNKVVGKSTFVKL